MKHFKKPKKTARYGNRTQVKYTKARRKNTWANTAYKTFKKTYKHKSYKAKPYYKTKYVYKNKKNGFYDYLNQKTNEYYADLRRDSETYPTMFAAISGIPHADDSMDLSWSDDEASRKVPRTQHEQNALNAMMNATDRETDVRDMEWRNEREARWEDPFGLNNSTMSEFDAY